MIRPSLAHAAAALSITAFTGTAAAAALPGPDWNGSPDPDAPVGLCHIPGGSALGTKWSLVAAVGETSTDVIAIQLLHCLPYSYGGAAKVSCDTVEAGGVPYAYCARTRNDGQGNDVAIGVLRRDAITDPLGVYTGCPRGQTPQSKLAVIQAAGGDPRRVDGIVTLGCGPAIPGGARAPVPVACPVEPHPYAACVATRNDGHGNSVILGVVRSNGPGDPYALFGECNTDTDIAPGFLSKADALREAGVSLANVRTVDQLTCQVPWGMGGWVPDHFERWSCASVPGMTALLRARYDACVVGTDIHGNGAVFGVVGGP